ncbi:hypothetical protein HYALB_00001042 [Hymenoscyphus albidus]|uniref:Uncharacterized protein n=1 Tax=Hymenoscyphus albidus TaxID=595503 RepID=A0A9N9M464_9HELO|nr:hypothetical protein HYALB_00001042 [Hymenoscyphus albidus]
MSGNQQHNEIPLSLELTRNEAPLLLEPPLLTTTEIISRGRQRIAALQAATTSFNDQTTKLLSSNTPSLLWNPPLTPRPSHKPSPNPDPPARNIRRTRRGQRDPELTIESSELWSLPIPAMEGLGAPLGFGSETQNQTPAADASRASMVGLGAKVRSSFSKEKKAGEGKMGMRGKKGASLEELTRLAEAFVREPEYVERKGGGSEGARSEDEGEWHEVDLGTGRMVKRG